VAIFNRSRFQSYYRYKNIINVNKNAKLEEFYNIRNRFIFYKKPFNFRRLLRRFRNMKWMIAKFKMVPRILFYPSLFKKHNYIFKKKQQLKIFYGKLSEKKFKTIVLKSKNSSKTLENSSYFNVIETRLDMLLYRAKFLPTIFSCNQLLTHKKILINNNIITNKTAYPIKQGDFISLKKDYWGNIYKYLVMKSNKRLIGHKVLKQVKTHSKKRSSNRSKLRKIFYSNFKYADFAEKYKKRFDFYLEQVQYVVKCRHKALGNTYLKEIAIFIAGQFFNKISQFNTISQNLRRWNVANYVQHDILGYLYKHQLRYLLNVLNISFKEYFLPYSIAVSKRIPARDFKMRVHYWNKTGIYREAFINSRLPVMLEDFDIKIRRHYNFYSNLYQISNIKSYPINNPSHLEAYPWFNPNPQWYTPKYLETDYTTLRIGIIQKPQEKDIMYPFNINLSSLYNFYSLKGY
jgi:ribosomal protein S4